MNFLKRGHLLLTNVTVKFQMDLFQDVWPFIGICHPHEIEDILYNPMGKETIVHILHVERNSRTIKLIHQRNGGSVVPIQYSHLG
ncbi:hypothetical protein D3C75_786330 [compost metagenome]